MQIKPFEYLKQKITLRSVIEIRYAVGSLSYEGINVLALRILIRHMGMDSIPDRYYISDVALTTIFLETLRIYVFRL